MINLRHFLWNIYLKFHTENLVLYHKVDFVFGKNVINIKKNMLKFNPNIFKMYLNLILVQFNLLLVQINSSIFKSVINSNHWAMSSLWEVRDSPIERWLIKVIGIHIQISNSLWAWVILCGLYSCQKLVICFQNKLNRNARF